jgi:glycosyltransferase involved in cell wall biosynthesis
MGFRQTFRTHGSLARRGSSEDSLGKRPIRIFFPCTGLGRQRRGFETFTIECATALQMRTELEMTVFSGAGTREVPSTALWNLPRDSTAARWLAALHRRGAYYSEQLTFFLSFLPHLIAGRPDVVYFADLNLGNLCWHWRRLSRQDYRLLFYNGGLTTMPFTRADFVQQVTPFGLSEATQRGEDPTRQIVLPHGVRVSPEVPTRITGYDRTLLGLPSDRRIVLSVGLLGSSIKRMDYLIREVASMRARPYLVMLGAQTEETPSIRLLANELLGLDGFMMKTVEPSLLDSYYRAADVFVLASLREGFGLAYVEALARGLPVVAHDFAVTQYLLGDLGFLGDLTTEGNAARLISAILAIPAAERERRARHESARARFGWDVLRERYAGMLSHVAQLEPDAT